MLARLGVQTQDLSAIPGQTEQEYERAGNPPGDFTGIIYVRRARDGSKAPEYYVNGRPMGESGFQRYLQGSGETSVPTVDFSQSARTMARAQYYQQGPDGTFTRIGGSSQAEESAPTAADEGARQDAGAGAASGLTFDRLARETPGAVGQAPAPTPLRRTGPDPSEEDEDTTIGSDDQFGPRAEARYRRNQETALGAGQYGEEEDLELTARSTPEERRQDLNFDARTTQAVIDRQTRQAQEHLGAGQYGEEEDLELTSRSTPERIRQDLDFDARQGQRVQDRQIARTEAYLVGQGYTEERLGEMTAAEITALAQKHSAAAQSGFDKAQEGLRARAQTDAQIQQAALLDQEGDRQDQPQTGRRGTSPMTLEQWKARGTVFINGQPVDVAQFIKDNTSETAARVVGASISQTGATTRDIQGESEAQVAAYLNQGLRSGGIRLEQQDFSHLPQVSSKEALGGHFMLDGQVHRTDEYFGKRRSGGGRTPAQREANWERQDDLLVQELQELRSQGRLQLMTPAGSGLSPDGESILAPESTGAVYQPRFEGGLNLGNLYEPGAELAVPGYGYVRGEVRARDPQSQGGRLYSDQERRSQQWEAAFLGLDVIPVPTKLVTRPLASGARLAIERLRNVVARNAADDKIISALRTGQPITRQLQRQASPGFSREIDDLVARGKLDLAESPLAPHDPTRSVALDPRYDTPLGVSHGQGSIVTRGRGGPFLDVDRPPYRSSADLSHKGRATGPEGEWDLPSFEATGGPGFYHRPDPRGSFGGGGSGGGVATLSRTDLTMDEMLDLIASTRGREEFIPSTTAPGIRPAPGRPRPDVATPRRTRPQPIDNPGFQPHRMPDGSTLWVPAGAALPAGAVTAQTQPQARLGERPVVRLGAAQPIPQRGSATQPVTSPVTQPAPTLGARAQAQPVTAAATGVAHQQGAQPIAEPSMGRQAQSAVASITQPATEYITEDRTQPVTEPFTRTQPVTEPFTRTQPVTEPFTRTQPVTEPFTRTQPVTEPFTRTQPVTEPFTRTQPVTEPFTRTQPVTEPETPVPPRLVQHLRKAEEEAAGGRMQARPVPRGGDQRQQEPDEPIDPTGRVHPQVVTFDTTRSISTDPATGEQTAQPVGTENVDTLRVVRRSPRITAGEQVVAGNLQLDARQDDVVPTVLPERNVPQGQAGAGPSGQVRERRTIDLVADTETVQPLDAAGNPVGAPRVQPVQRPGDDQVPAPDIQATRVQRLRHSLGATGRTLASSTRQGVAAARTGAAAALEGSATGILNFQQGQEQGRQERERLARERAEEEQRRREQGRGKTAAEALQGFASRIRGGDAPGTEVQGVDTAPRATAAPPRRGLPAPQSRAEAFGRMFANFGQQAQRGRPNDLKGGGRKKGKPPAKKKTRNDGVIKVVVQYPEAPQQPRGATDSRNPFRF